eukprot:scaffold12772_cov126-Isochrysis_galbana.AAC.4
MPLAVHHHTQRIEGASRCEAARFALRPHGAADVPWSSQRVLNVLRSRRSEAGGAGATCGQGGGGGS